MLFIICDYFCKWGFCCEIDKGSLQQVCHRGLSQSHGLPSAQRCGLHEGMLHLEIMHEKKKSHKENNEFLNSIHLPGRGNWVITGGALLILFHQIQPPDQVDHFGQGEGVGH